MFIIECAAAALIAIALGILVDEDTRDMRIRFTRDADGASICALAPLGRGPALQ